QIIILPQEKGFITNNTGGFEISGNPEYKSLQVYYLGYVSQTVPISENTSELGTISLLRSNTTLDEVIVSASPNNFKKDFKGSNFRLSPLQLKNINPLNTEEVLKMVPGINIVGDMGLSNRPNISIRGSWGRRSKKVLLMEDGTPSAPAPYIAPGAYYNPVSDRITAVEVYKGADMLRYGPNNMYGAVNYITALPPQKPELRIKLIGGERNYQTGLLSYGGTWNSIGALVEGVYKSFDGFTDNSSVKLLNLNAKLFAKLSNNQSLYFKVSGQFEDNQASLSSQTPFTFEQDPTQNPLDADQFTMRRYGLDMIHKWLVKDNISVTSKIYATDFERDWWRQITTKIKASDAFNYLGETIYNDRYSYLNNASFNNEDYLIVGRIIDGKEATTDSRWTYTVSGIKETATVDWNAFNKTQHLEASINFHRETFKDRLIEAYESRWARSGTTTIDLWYRLWSFNGFVRNEFNVNKWSFTPILRFEHVNMYRQDLIATAQDPTITNTKDGRAPNVYNQFLPGLTVDYDIKNGELFGSIYEGMIAPSKVFGFLVEQNGVVTNPFGDESINIKPELSLNTEIGWRGSLLKNVISGQLVYFNNTSRNFYAGGRNEVFQELGKINVQGIELGANITFLSKGNHQASFFTNLSAVKSKVLEGKLADNDLFSQVVHNNATQTEYINKVNNNRNAYQIYVQNTNGEEVLFTNTTLTESDFPNITKSIITFGNNGISRGEAPYTPSINLTNGLNYNWKDLSLGVSGNYVGKQFTEFNNFKSESSDGSIGELPSYVTIDTFANYDFTMGEKVQINAFLNIKNLTNNIYRASRLNRATSGIFPGGFRQIIIGTTIKI
ncbi:MAG: TonB-dependent receptor plug domain-containing protein, partial [Flavobacteriaceae bacterium]|nr:TonB-dependent receptor plug domain-containing protein [Flavobacteriaceae bacterium]